MFIQILFIISIKKSSINFEASSIIFYFEKKSNNFFS